MYRVRKKWKIYMVGKVKWDKSEQNISFIRAAQKNHAGSLELGKEVVLGGLPMASEVQQTSWSLLLRPGCISIELFCLKRTKWLDNLYHFLISILYTPTLMGGVKLVCTHCQTLSIYLPYCLEKLPGFLFLSWGCRSGVNTRHTPIQNT